MLQALRISLASLSVVVFLLSQAGWAQAPPNADTFATSVNPTQNFGSSGSLAVQQNSVAYMRFTLSTVPTGASVTKATLRVFVDFLVTPGTVDAYQLNVGWIESRLTWNNRPALGTSATGSHPVSISASSTCERKPRPKSSRRKSKRLMNWNSGCHGLRGLWSTTAEP